MRAKSWVEFAAVARCVDAPAFVCVAVGERVGSRADTLTPQLLRLQKIVADRIRPRSEPAQVRADSDTRHTLPPPRGRSTTVASALGRAHVIGGLSKPAQRDLKEWPTARVAGRTALGPDPDSRLTDEPRQGARLGVRAREPAWAINSCGWK